MRISPVALIAIAVATGAGGAMVVPDARGSRPALDARTALERSVMHDQASAAAVARPPFEVTRVRCSPRHGFCNVRRETTAARLSRVVVVRVPVVVGPRGSWRYRALDTATAAKLRASRDEGRVVWAISATWSD